MSSPASSATTRTPAQSLELLFRLIGHFDNQDRRLTVLARQTSVQRAAVDVAVQDLAIQHTDVLPSVLIDKLGVLLTKPLHLLQQLGMALLAQKAVDQIFNDLFDRGLLSPGHQAQWV
jgi:hypothetical protein